MADAETWWKRVAEWRESGLTADAYCAQSGLSRTSLYWWSGKLRRDATVEASTMSLARVEVKSAPKQEDTRGGVVLEVDGVRLSVASSASREALVLILEALDIRAGRRAR